MYIQNILMYYKILLWSFVSSSFCESVFFARWWLFGINQCQVNPIVGYHLVYNMCFSDSDYIQKLDNSIWRYINPEISFCFLFCVFHPFVFSRMINGTWLPRMSSNRSLIYATGKRESQENGQFISLTFADITIKASRIHMENVWTIFTCSCQHFNYCLPFCTEKRQIFYSPSPWWDVI